MLNNNMVHVTYTIKTQISMYKMFHKIKRPRPLHLTYTPNIIKQLKMPNLKSIITSAEYL